jgi:hypothetical protein
MRHVAIPCFFCFEFVMLALIAIVFMEHAGIGGCAIRPTEQMLLAKWINDVNSAIARFFDRGIPCKD